MQRLPSYIHKSKDKTYYIRFKLYNCTYEVHGFLDPVSAMEHKMWMESQLLNGWEFKNKIIKTPMS